MTMQRVDSRPGWASPIVSRRQLGFELRRLRERAGLTGDEVAKALFWSPSKISRYEWAKTVAVPGEVEKFLDYFGVTGAQRDYLLQLVRIANETGWWDDYAADIPLHQRELIGLEHAAADILIWQTSIIPPLLQTEAYARHVVRSFRRVEPSPPQQVARRVGVTMMRQQVLAREPPPSITVVLDEAAVRRPVGEAQVMGEQLYRLTGLAGEHPAVTVQVLPLTCQQPVFTSSFTIFGFGPATSHDVLQDVVAIDHLTSSCLVDGEREAYLYRLTFQRLVAAALDIPASRALLTEVSGFRTAIAVGAGDSGA